MKISRLFESTRKESSAKLLSNNVELPNSELNYQDDDLQGQGVQTAGARPTLKKIRII